MKHLTPVPVCAVGAVWTDVSMDGGQAMTANNAVSLLAATHICSQVVAGVAVGSSVTALDAGFRITGPSPATRPDSECGSPAPRTVAPHAGSDELPAGCPTRLLISDEDAT